MKTILSKIIFIGTVFLMYTNVFSMQHGGRQPAEIIERQAQIPQGMGQSDLNLTFRYDRTADELNISGLPHGRHYIIHNASDQVHRHIKYRTALNASEASIFDEVLARELIGLSDRFFAQNPSRPPHNPEDMGLVLNYTRRFCGICPLSAFGFQELVEREKVRWDGCVGARKRALFFKALGEIALCYILIYLTSDFSISNVLNFRLPASINALINPASVGGVMNYDGTIRSATRGDGLYGLCIGISLFYFIPLIYSYVIINGIHAAEDLVVLVGRLLYACVIGSTQDDAQDAASKRK